MVADPNLVGEYRDAGSAFYSADFWSVWDISIVLIGLAFFICRKFSFQTFDRAYEYTGMIGLSQDSNDITGTAFDILATQALFLLPRLCSILSLNPYFGTLVRHFYQELARPLM